MEINEFNEKHPVARFGDKGDAIKIIQSVVGVPKDGLFGYPTLEAVKKWQTANGLVSDGVVGPVTWAKITEY